MHWTPPPPSLTFYGRRSSEYTAGVLAVARRSRRLGRSNSPAKFAESGGGLRRMRHRVPHRGQVLSRLRTPPKQHTSCPCGFRANRQRVDRKTGLARNLGRAGGKLLARSHSSSLAVLSAFS